MMELFIYVMFGYLLGGIPFSLILGKLIVKKDIRTVGDGNPGGTNAIKAGGLKVGLPAILLDMGKGFLPVFLARQNDFSGWDLVLICLAPILGHAFSPFLRFHGGKALGTTGGVWVGLIGLWAFPIYALGALPILAIQDEHAYAASAGMVALLGYAVFGLQTQEMILLAFLNFLVVLWTHRKELRQGIQFRPWVGHFTGRGI